MPRKNSSKSLFGNNVLMALGSLVVLASAAFVSFNYFGPGSMSTDNRSDASTLQARSIETDPISFDYYNFYLTANPITSRATAPGGTLYRINPQFRLYDNRFHDLNQVTGFLQRQSSVSPASFTFFKNNQAVAGEFTSSPVELGEGEKGCIDLHRDAKRSNDTYLGTFCFAATTLSLPYAPMAATAYSPTGTPYLSLRYSNPDRASTVMVLTTVFNKNSIGRINDPQNTINKTRVHFVGVEDGTEGSYEESKIHIDPITYGSAAVDQDKWCGMGGSFPLKYLTQSLSPSIDGAQKLTVNREGSCTFTTSQKTPQEGFLALTKDGGVFPSPTPSAVVIRPTPQLSPMVTARPPQLSPMVTARPTPSPIRPPRMLPVLQTTSLPKAAVGRIYRATVQVSLPGGYSNEVMNLTRLPAGLRQEGCSVAVVPNGPSGISCIISGVPTRVTPSSYTIGVLVRSGNTVLLSKSLEMVVVESSGRPR